MQINEVIIQDTFAEAWELEVVRLVITAISADIALGGAQQFVGAAGSSELGSKINGGIERPVLPGETPDGRPGVVVALTMPPALREQLLQELALRVHLATLIPTCAVYDYMVPGTANRVAISIHDRLAVNWQGVETEEIRNGRRLCLVPTLTGKFTYEKELTIATRGSDGHFVCYAMNEAAAVLAVQAAKNALEAVEGTAPMGFGLEQVYKLHEYCPALRESVQETKVPPGVGSILNLLYFGISREAVAAGLKAAITAAVQVPGVLQIGAMNFGGTFGPYKYYLREILG